MTNKEMAMLLIMIVSYFGSEGNNKETSKYGDTVHGDAFSLWYKNNR